MITDQTYELDDQTALITYANGVTIAFTYSPTRCWLLRIVTTNTGGAALIDNVNARDGGGRIVSITGLTPSDSSTYVTMFPTGW